MSTGSGTLGWIATQVQRKMVVMQLQMMLRRLLQSSKSLHEDEVLSSLIAGTGRACAESKWTRRRMIMVLAEFSSRVP